MPKRRHSNQLDFIEFPACTVTELAQTRDFFTQVFGWSYKKWDDDYVDTQDSGLGSGINADTEHRPRMPLAVIYAVDLETTCANVMAAGGEITKEIFAFPGGRRFHFTDPAGNELAVWSDR